MNFIIDPLTKLKYSLFSNNGKQLLKKYIKHVQIGGGMNIDPTTGVFYGFNKSGRADAAFFNNLGILSYGHFNRQVLDDFITYPTRRVGHLNMSLLGALDRLPIKYLKIDDGRGHGPEQDIKNAIEVRITDGKKFESHDGGHVNWAALLGRIRNYIRVFKSYVNKVENNPKKYTRQQQLKIRNQMLGEIEITNYESKNTGLYEDAFRQASATKTQTELDMEQAKKNIGAEKSSSSAKPVPLPTSKPKPLPTSKPKPVPLPTSKPKPGLNEYQRKEYESLKKLLLNMKNPRIIKNIEAQLATFESEYEIP
jgi:hypothetical protein